MEESGGSSTSKFPSNDPGWKYFEMVYPGNKNNIKCKFCKNVYKGGIYRAKQHLAGGYRNASVCAKVPALVAQEIKDFMDKKKTATVNPAPPFNPSGNFEDMIYLDNEMHQPTPNDSSTATPTSNKRQRQGPMDAFIKKIAAPRTKERQTTVTEAFNKELREKTIQAIANWMYDAAIPFNAVNYPSFQVMCDMLSRAGPGFKPPTYHEVRVTCLSKVVTEVEQEIQTCRDEWKKVGCSLMVDGWIDKRQRTLINFLVNSPKGTVFLELVDASEYAKTGEKMAELIEGVINKIGGENVVQVISDNASNMVLAGTLLEQRWPCLYWTPCAAHCIDLMLEDIGKLPRMKNTLKQAMSVTAYVYVRPGVVNMLRSFTDQKELCRAGVTRFATAFLTLQRMLELKPNLRNMFSSEQWTQSKWSKELDGKKVARIIISAKILEQCCVHPKDI
ncbi:hypothetical protein ACS0TY_007126 [Phlomoides rotata]